MPIGQAVFNVAHAALLAVGLARGDWDLLSRGLQDQLHQERRSHLFPRSFELAGRARELGALGATISGAGPTVLVWCFYEQTGVVAGALAQEVEGWAQLMRAPFESQGAYVGRALSELGDPRPGARQLGQALEQFRRQRRVVGAEVRAVVEDRARPLGRLGVRDRGADDGVEDAARRSAPSATPAPRASGPCACRRGSAGSRAAPGPG